MSRREWLWCWFIVSLVSAAAILLMLAGTASATTTSPTPGLVLNGHNVVQSSTLQPCTFTQVDWQDRVPCSYNFGWHTGNGTAEAYWIGRDYVAHWVWGHTPYPIRIGTAHWATRADRARRGIGRDCWVRGQRYKCPAA